MGIVLATIAIVDDDESIRSALRQLLRSAEFDARTFASAEDFLTSPELEQMDMLIADINLPGMNGVALLRALAASGRGIPAVLITARDDAGTLELIRRAGPVPHLRKPFSDDELFDAIAELLSR
ncbi:MAG: response regulator [Gemmatimonadetes bacterium]|nr:response regulator [Gemmatimonadota bacterium]